MYLGDLCEGALRARHPLFRDRPDQPDQSVCPILQLHGLLYSVVTPYLDRVHVSRTMYLVICGEAGFSEAFVTYYIVSARPMRGCPALDTLSLVIGQIRACVSPCSYMRPTCSCMRLTLQLHAFHPAVACVSPCSCMCPTLQLHGLLYSLVTPIP